jgi:hypothetical protein
MNLDEFKTLIKPVTDAIAGKPFDRDLEADLNRRFPPGSKTFTAIEAACQQAIAAGWMCSRGEPGCRFGRVIKPGPETHELSVDVVDLTDFVGPHHRHPKGEVCLTMPITPTAKFDGHGAGWCVNAPGSAHHPTVTDGQALVLYLLPDGAIEFTG